MNSSSSNVGASVSNIASVSGDTSKIEELLSKNLNDEFGIESIRKEGNKSIGVVGEGHKGYYFEGQVKNGKLHGKAFLYSPLKELIGEVIFVEGKMNGECKFYKNGKLYWEGRMVNGYRNGLGVEYDEDGLPNRFVYENGLKKMEEMDDDSDYWKEVNDSGEIVSIWKLNDKGERDGECYLYEDGDIKYVKLFKNGKEVRLMKEFEGGKMKEYDKNGILRYKGGYRNDFKSGYLREGKGILYDESGNATIYKGKFKNGKVDGKGVLYKNKLKDTLICGHSMFLWLSISLFLLIVVIVLVIGIVMFVNDSEENDCLIRSDPELLYITIPSNSCNMESQSDLDLSGFDSLKSIVIDDNNYEFVNEFRIEGLWNLEDVEIGSSCFTRNNGSFHISDCNKLKQLMIKENSFNHFSVFELRDLPTLESIEIGTIGIPSYNFVFSSLALESMD